MSFAQYDEVTRSQKASSPEADVADVRQQEFSFLKGQAVALSNRKAIFDPDQAAESFASKQDRDTKELTCDRSGLPGRKRIAKTQFPPSNFSLVMDRLYKDTDFKHKQWEEQCSLIHNSSSVQTLSSKICAFYFQMDQKAERNRRELFQNVPLRTASSACVETKLKMFKDLQGSLALTARKVYEHTAGVPEEKCEGAKEFVDGVLMEFQQMDRRVWRFAWRCLLRLEFACEKLQSREVVMAEVGQHGLVLQLASEKLQSDKELVVAAVQQDGFALEFASEELQDNKEVVMQAVKQHGDSLQFASARLQSDDEVVKTAVQHDSGERLHQHALESCFKTMVQYNDISVAMNFYRTLKAVIDANQADLCASTSLSELLDKSQKLQKALLLHNAMEESVSNSDMKLKELIRSRVDLNQRYHDPSLGELTPFCHAVALNCPKLINLLYKEGADPIHNLFGRPTPIRYADNLGARADLAFAALAEFPECLRAQDITVRIIERLTKAGVDMNSSNELGQTPLHFHGVAGRVEVVTALVENNAELNRKDLEGNTPLDLAIQAGMSEELKALLDYVDLHIGLGAQPIALRTSLVSKHLDVVSFLRQYVQAKKMEEGTRVSYFSIRLAVGDRVAENNRSWEALGKPKTLFIILNCNFREDPELAKDFLKVAAQKGVDADHKVQGHLENFQDPDVRDERGQAAVHKASRNDDAEKLEFLHLACANLDIQDNHGATALFIGSQNGCLNAVQSLVNYQAQLDLPLPTKATPLYVACQNGFLLIAKFLLASGADPNSRTDDLATPLFIAAQMGNLLIVKALLEATGNIELANRSDATPLFIACQNNHKDIAHCLLLAEANINKRTTGGASPTYIAAQKGSMEALTLLLEDPRVDANLSANDGATPMVIAAQNGHRKAVRLLLKKKADVRKAMKSGATTLFVAAQNGFLGMVQDLVVADSSLVNVCLDNGTSPMYVAAQNGYVNVVKYLHEQKGDIWKESCGGASPFFIASQNGHEEVLNFLLEVERKNQRPIEEHQVAKETHDGSTALVVASQNGHLAIVQVLIAEHRDVCQNTSHQEFIDHKKLGGATALYLASQNGYANVVRHLIGLRASVNEALDTKETPLFIASQGGHAEVVQFLLQAAANANQGKHDDTTPLYIASQNHHVDVFNLLLEAKADPDAPNKNGATPLFISAQKGFSDIVKVLIAENADPTRSIQSGACPLYVAAMKGHSEVCRKLLMCGTDANQTPRHQTTPLLIAIRNSHLEVAALFLEFLEANEATVDVNKADAEGNTALLTAAKANSPHLVQKLLACGAKVDHGMFDDGIGILRAIPQIIASFAKPSMGTSANLPFVRPHVSAESVERYVELFWRTQKDAETLSYHLVRLNEGVQNLANDLPYSQLALQVEQLRIQVEEALDLTKAMCDWKLGLGACFGLVHNAVEQSCKSIDVKNVEETRVKLLMARATLLSACSLMRVCRDTSAEVFLPFMKSLKCRPCGTFSDVKMQNLISDRIFKEVQQVSKLNGGLEALRNTGMV